MKFSVRITVGIPFEVEVRATGDPAQTAAGAAVAVAPTTPEAYVIAEEAVPTQPFPSVPDTVYVVVTEGDAVTLAPVVAERPAAGPHAYVDAPVAEIAMPGPPEQNVAEVGVTLTAGSGFTVSATVVVKEAAHPSDTTSEYVPLIAGVTAPSEGFCTVEEKLFGPVHAYVYGAPPPTGTPFNVTVVPSQTGEDGDTELVAVSAAPATMVTLPVAAQPLLEALTVYVVVAVMFVAIGFAIAGLLRNVEGDHV